MSVWIEGEKYWARVDEIETDPYGFPVRMSKISMKIVDRNNGDKELATFTVFGSAIDETLAEAKAALRDYEDQVF